MRLYCVQRLHYVLHLYRICIASLLRTAPLLRTVLLQCLESWVPGDCHRSVNRHTGAITSSWPQDQFSHLAQPQCCCVSSQSNEMSHGMSFILQPAVEQSQILGLFGRKREREKETGKEREREREREKGEAASFCSYLSPRMPTTLHHDSRRAQPKRGEAFVGFSKKTSSFHRADAIQRSTHCASSENVPCGCVSHKVQWRCLNAVI